MLCLPGGLLVVLKGRETAIASLLLMGGLLSGYVAANAIFLPQVEKRELPVFAMPSTRNSSRMAICPPRGIGLDGIPGAGLGVRGSIRRPSTGQQAMKEKIIKCR